MTEVTTGALVVTAVVAILSTIFLIVVIVLSRSSRVASRPLPNTSTMMTSSSSRTTSWKYDVFLSFRGEDTRKTFVDHLYNALVQQTVCTYKDNEKLSRGDTIGPSLLRAIQESQIALIVFSKNYAESSWCLDELAYIMKCKEERGQIVIPIFYGVDPSYLRKQNGQIGKAFSKHRKSARFETWRKALNDASNIAGWETKHIANGHEAVGIKIIVGTVLDKLLYVNSDVDENLVGMGPRFKYFESQLQIGSHGVRMIGIWGVGGGGKTTLAFSVYMKIRDNYQGHCFIGNVCEESGKHGLQKQQEKVLSEVLKTKVLVGSVHEGRYKIQSMLCRRKVLIVLDDVDDLEQLEALVGSHDWFGGGSRIIITTRDEHLLTTHRVDEVCPVSLLSDDEAIRLFKRHAYKENNPVEDYDNLSFRVISYVNGLPLALKILGSFLYDKDKNEWISCLDKLREIPNRKVTDQLKISYDGLEHDEKQIFLDIACFFRRCQTEKAMRILDACGFHPHIGTKVLMQKALITISSEGFFDMHDLVQEMGQHIVRGEYPNNPEKHSRVWRSEEIEDICSRNATMENNMIEAIQYAKNDPPSKNFTTLVSNLKILRFLEVITWHEDSYDEGPTFISNEMRYMDWYGYPASLLPETFEPRKLLVLGLDSTLQIELWKGQKHLPCLKELILSYAKSLVKTPDFSGLPCLQKLILLNCDRLEEIDASLGNHTSVVNIYVGHCEKLIRFPTIVRMKKLEIFEVTNCNALLEFPKIEANMDSLVNLHLENVRIEVLPSSVGTYCTNLISLMLKDCSKLKSIDSKLHALKHLKQFKLTGVTQLEKYPKDLFDENCFLEELLFDLKYSSGMNNLRPNPPKLPRLLKKLNLSGFKLKDGEVPCEISELSNLQELYLCGNHFSRLDFSLSQLTRLKLLNLSRCHNLVELPMLPSNIVILQADYCYSLEAIGYDIYSNSKWLSQVSITKSDGEGCGSLVGGVKLLESMLQGKNIQNHHCMSLNLQGLEIPKAFEPRLVRGNRFRLKLAENWYNEYTGFLFCAVLKEYNRNRIGPVKITMRQEVVHIRMWDSQVFWEQESVNDDKLHTWVGRLFH
uniref:TMV resistance protein N-like n=1 Tax=Erigeron canadensis TaxID=72917 RepID=UPI001CB8F8AC|nr:TMV resistance protein N-like [Erigeron canadensis]